MPRKPQKRKKKKPDERSTKERMQAFMEAFAATCNIVVAARRAGIARALHYQWMEKYPRYAAAFKEAQRLAGDYLESVAVERGTQGWLEAVYYQGAKCGTVRRYDGSLLQFLLRGVKPEKYSQKTEITGLQGQPIAAKIEVVFREPEAERSPSPIGR